MVAPPPVAALAPAAVEESETVQSALRHIASLEGEIEAVERLIGKQMLNWAGGPAADDRAGVNLIATAT
jgi:hypothetical protein